jgi:long-chain acyl-CoA synthetase
MLDDLGGLLPLAAARFGDRTALVIEGQGFSFRELDTLSTRLAHALVGLGVRPGERVSLYAGNSWRWVVGYYGALKAGAVINPLNTMLTAEEVAFATSDCQARVIMAPPDKGQALLDIQRDTPLEHVILLGGDRQAGALAFDDLLLGNHAARPDVPVDPLGTSTIGYTSGTTGHPKGAMQTQRAVLLNAAMYANMIARTPADTVVTGVPLPHVYGTVLLNGCLMTGAKLVQMARFDANAALDLAAEHRATVIEGVPTMFMYMLNSPKLAATDLSSLRLCMVGGQTMPVAKMEEVEARFACPLKEIWGMTEIAGVGTAHPVLAPKRLGSIGIPLLFNECRVADVEDAGRTMPDGEDGELMVRGPIVMQGYFGNARATRETIEPDGWMHTGDIARRDADGFYFVVDRKKDMILTAGFNVYPAEIERVVAAHPAVALVAVGSQPDTLKGEVAKAYVVLKTGAVEDEAEILAYCRQHLAAYKVPRAVQFVDDVPKTSTGKVMRRELRKLDA